jgi:hypothetical protein
MVDGCRAVELESEGILGGVRVRVGKNVDSNSDLSLKS